MPGSFTYVPAVGSVLNAGPDQVLTAVFTPDDTNNYTSVTNTVALSVLKARLTATADNQSRAYGEANPPLTITYSGFVNGDTAAVVDAPPIASTSALPASPPGSYPITLTGGSDNNYNLTLIGGTLTISETDNRPDFHWVRTAGGPATDRAAAITTDASGNLYVTGYFWQGISFGETMLAGFGTVKSAFVAKYDADGQLRWAQEMGGANGSAQGDGIAVDQNGNVFVVGNFAGTVSIGGNVLASNGANGSPDLFVTKFSSEGAFLWARQGGGTAYDAGTAVVVDANGSAFVTGYFTGPATFGSAGLAGIGNIDVLLVNYDGDGNVVWAREAGSTGADTGYGMALDSAGNAVMTGNFSGEATFGSDNLTSSGSYDAFVSKLDGEGNFLWTRRAGGTGTDSGRGVTLDAGDSVFVSGFFSYAADFGSTNLTGGNDAFLAKYDSEGTLLWARHAGGTGMASAAGLAVRADSDGNVICAGLFKYVCWFETTSLDSGVNYDAFIAKYDGDGSLRWALRCGNYWDESATGVVIDGNGNIFMAGYFDLVSNFGTNTVYSVGDNDTFVAKLIPAALPEIISVSPNQVKGVGADVVFSVTAIGAGALRYQWVKNGIDIPGATSASLIIANAQPSDGGDRKSVV